MVNILFPKRCINCGKLDYYFCPECRCLFNQLEIKPNEAVCPVCVYPSISGQTHVRCLGKYKPDGLVSIYRYKGIVKKAIKKIKYRYNYDLVAELVELIPDCIESRLAEINPGEDAIIIPVPLFADRKKERGFNQAEQFARYLGQKLKIKTESDILLRTGKSMPQVTMKNKSMRFRNTKNIFSINPVRVLSLNPAVLLVDDVFTTGATLCAAASVLKKAGFQQVWGITIAR